MSAWCDASSHVRIHTFSRENSAGFQGSKISSFDVQPSQSEEGRVVSPTFQSRLSNALSEPYLSDQSCLSKKCRNA